MSATLEIVGGVTTEEDNRKAGRCPICGGGKVADLLGAPDRFHMRTDVYRLSRCQSCGVAWVANPPKPGEMGRHYTAEYHKDIVAAGEGSATRRWKNQVKRISHYKPGGAILDIGCSSGGFLSTMKGPAWKLHGIEMEESTARRCRDTTGAEVFQGDAMDAPFLPASFDVITCFDVLEHVYHPRQFLTKVLHWLKPGGILYAVLPNIDSWESRLFGTYWYGLELPRHLFHFSPTSIRYLLEDIGFEEVRLRTPRVDYIERSLAYASARVLEKMEHFPASRFRPKQPGLPLRIIRKAARLVFVAPLAQMASLADAGPSLEVVFRKSEQGKVASPQTTEDSSA